MSTIEQITEALKPLADKIGQGAKIEWAAYYRQTYIDAWTTIIFWGVCLLLVLTSGLLLAKYFNGRSKYYSIAQKGEDSYDRRRRDGDRESMVLGRWATLIITGLTSLLIFGLILVNGIQPLLNPVYQTTHDIIGEYQGTQNGQ